MQLVLFVPAGSRLLGMQAKLVVPDGFGPLVVLGHSRPLGMQAELMVPDGCSLPELQIEAFTGGWSP